MKLHQIQRPLLTLNPHLLSEARSLNWILPSHALIGLKLISDTNVKGIEQLYDEGMSLSTNIFANKPWFQKLFKHFYITDRDIAQNIIDSVSGKRNNRPRHSPQEQEKNQQNKGNGGQSNDLIKTLTSKMDDYVNRSRELANKKALLQGQLPTEALSDIKNAISGHLNLQKTLRGRVVKNHNHQIISQVMYWAASHFLDRYRSVLQGYGLTPEQVTKTYQLANNYKQQPGQRYYNTDNLRKIQEILRSQFAST